MGDVRAKVFIVLFKIRTDKIDFVKVSREPFRSKMHIKNLRVQNPV